jgi:hypothetical protein
MSSGGIVALAVVGVVGLVVVLLGAALFVGSEASSSSTFSSTGDTVGGALEAPSDVEPVTMPEGFAPIDGDGVSIAAPEQWQAMDVDALSMGSEEFSQAFPDVPPDLVEQGLATAQEGAVLVAFDVSDPDFSSSVNIIEVPLEAPLSEVGGYAELQLQALNGEIVESGQVTIPAGEAVRVAYTIPVTLPDGTSRSVGGVQYYLPTGGHTYIVTITADAALADQMIDTFRVD